jgi:hypothetical protein
MDSETATVLITLATMVGQLGYATAAWKLTKKNTERLDGLEPKVTAHEGRLGVLERGAA